MLSHLVVDGGPELNENEAESHHGQNTEEGSQEYGEPHVRLVQRVPCGAWSSKSNRSVSQSKSVYYYTALEYCILKFEDMGINNLSASINELNLLTDEGERGGEDEKHAVAVHGHCDGKVSGQAAPHKKLVHCGPVVCVQTQLKNVFIFYSGAH